VARGGAGGAHRKATEEEWADQAMLLGWTAVELYRVPPLWSRLVMTGTGLLIGRWQVLGVVQAIVLKRAIQVLPEALGMKKWREIRVGDLSANPRNPLELYLFDPASSLRAMLEGDDQMLGWQAKVVSLVTHRIADKTAPPMRCMTCDHSFVAVPINLGFLKQAFGERTIVMAFYRRCAGLPLVELKKRIYGRLGGACEMPMGRA
jgi:hypothetical protein